MHKAMRSAMRSATHSAIRSIEGGLIVSCQARPDNPLHGPLLMAAMAEAAYRGGAVGIRADGPDDIAAIRGRVSIPIIGIYKRRYPDNSVVITPDFECAKAVVDAGADIVALSCAKYQRPDAGALETLIARIRTELRVSVMADISTLEEGILAERLGADMVASTLQGYTPETALPAGIEHPPDIALLKRLKQNLRCPIVAEGRYRSLEDFDTAFRYGAHAVVIGTAITNPMAITARFAARAPGKR